MIISLPVGGKAYDSAGRSVFRYHASRVSGLSYSKYGICVYVDGRKSACVRDGIGDIAYISDLLLAEARLIIDVLLGIFGYRAHGADSLSRIFAGSSLAREHDGTGSVIDGIGNVCYLGSRRTRIAYHGLKHLSRSDDYLARAHAFLDHDLLQSRYLLDGYLYAKVASRHHDAVRYSDNLIYIVNALAVLNLGDNAYFLSVVFL